METPIIDFVKQYAQSEKSRLHMPGHKGHDFLGIEKLDITEIDGADVLYSESGIIAESERNASRIFGTEKTLYSAGGSSLSVRAMLYLITLHAQNCGKEKLVAAFRNVHKTYVTASSLLDFETVWLYPEESCGIASCVITPEELDTKISSMERKPAALYVTSPDYLGNIADIKGISEVCKKHEMLLAVDNAHGAYLNFLPENTHPIALGADICCDSAHKTLPVLTGGGYLHISENAPREIAQNAERAMMLFASTSPSYLILQSLDLANKYTDGEYRKELSDFCKKVQKLKKELEDAGFELCGNEPLKLTVKTKPYGYRGQDFASQLEKSGIVCEFCDPDYLVLMLTPQNKCDLEKIKHAFLSVKKQVPIKESAPPAAHPKAVLSPRECLFLNGQEVPAEQSCGKVLCDLSVSCPPAIPVAVCGEVIDREVVALFEYYGIKNVRVTE